MHVPRTEQRHADGKQRCASASPIRHDRNRKPNLVISLCTRRCYSRHTQSWLKTFAARTKPRLTSPDIGVSAVHGYNAEELLQHMEGYCVCVHPAGRLKTIKTTCSDLGVLYCFV